MSYAGLTVVQLKEKLKEKGLSTSGVKSDLVARLTESDGATTAEAPVEAAKPEETVPVVAAPVETPKAAPVAAAKKTESAADASPAVDPKTQAVELLEVKAKRAEKFGDQSEADSLRRTIKRIEKFGLSKENPIYKELFGASKAFNKALPNKTIKAKK
ncbi:unnamed protein product [Kuraishia capsulata CBS 1993]|uniref:SAP domain-containing protein n=1 Tax=Kuraishia capsulata CBS 1993 TaxID=1382522 RepID=W6MR99_9ASCO|nr:uncharacterized protein KUCA_T00000336001 [Kuraishia capsulata CBS 1993]CDK24375.1 unnamed protein product [Kuraishia capsulata CBS 1993]